MPMIATANSRPFLRRSNGLSDRLFESAAIGHLGEGVEIGALEELVLQAALIVDVGGGADAIGASLEA